MNKFTSITYFSIEILGFFVQNSRFLYNLQPLRVLMVKIIREGIIFIFKIFLIDQINI